jgi:ketohexokinase
VSQFPAEDAKIRASNIVRRRGGNVPNTLEVLQQLISLRNPNGLMLVLAAVLPSSSSAAFQQIETSLGPDVDLKSCFYREDFQEPASSYIIKNTANDSRTIINYNTLPEMDYGEFVKLADSLGDNVIWYHFEARSRSLAI